MLQPPQEGSNWLATHLPGKFQEREIKAWIKSLTLNDRKKNQLQDWLKQVEAWLEAQTDDGFITKIRRAAVIWGTRHRDKTSEAATGQAHSSGVVHGKMIAGGPNTSALGAAT